MLTHSLRWLGRRIAPSRAFAADAGSDSMKLLAREGIELDLAVGSLGLFFIGFLLIFGLGILTGDLWQNNRIGAGVGACVCFMGIAGFLLHYGRSRILDRRADKLDHGRSVAEPLRATFLTSSSDADWILLFAIGTVI